MQGIRVQAWMCFHGGRRLPIHSAYLGSDPGYLAQATGLFSRLAGHCSDPAAEPDRGAGPDRGGGHRWRGGEGQQNLGEFAGFEGATEPAPNGIYH